MLKGTPPLALTFDDVLLRPAASEVLPHEARLTTRLTGEITLGLPLISAAMDTVTNVDLALAMSRAGGLGVLHRNQTPEAQAAEVRAVKHAPTDNQPHRVAAAVGTGAEHRARARQLIEAGADAIVIDTAHGHSRRVFDIVAALRDAYPDAQLIAGNVVTADATRALIEAGADAIKVGVGPGSICTTRVVAGVGVPQITAVAECAVAAEPYNVPVIADGGVRRSGDIVKAIAAGASVVMIGGLLAGTDEAPGERVTVDGQTLKRYRGMGSRSAMLAGSGDRYFQKGVEADKLVPEGVEAYVPYRGPVADVLHGVVGGLRAGMGYTGCATIEALRLHAEFVRISSAGLQESTVHDVVADPGAWA